MNKKLIRSLFGDILLWITWTLIMLNLLVSAANGTIDYSFHLTAIFIYPVMLLSYRVKEMLAND